MLKNSITEKVRKFKKITKILKNAEEFIKRKIVKLKEIQKYCLFLLLRSYRNIQKIQKN
jgi:hypothetical protein